MTDEPTVTHLARRLAHNDGHLIDDTDWEHASADLRKDYQDLARATLTVLGGPTDAQREVAVLDAEVRELTRQRDRYRDAWHAACTRAVRLRNRKPR
ncbi:hypothetical protein AB0454_22500 [Streptomyces sp. NPDC093509]|uniref:hypothetical protein n=1 Tax=Streptomyces sp. NPDC093509 TaxID=3154982 RepID=UPI00344E979E